MRLPFKFARRYLFGKKSTNAINIITGISLLGIAIGTAALVLVLSVFNGFEDLITGLFGQFNPDVKVSAAKGKSFTVDTVLLDDLREIEGVKHLSLSLEEVAVFEYKSNQDIGLVKGVDEYYKSVTGIDTTVREGVYRLRYEGRDMAVLGVGMRNKLAVNVDDLLATISVYMPKRKKTSALSKPFVEKLLYPAGTFVIQQDFDNQYILTSLDFAQRLIGVSKNTVSALELKLDADANPEAVMTALHARLGPDFLIKDRYQQDEAFLKLMNIEKWMSYAILSLTLFLVAFNMVGALWMIVLEKKKDIAILKSMGATDSLVRQIFLGEGLLICVLGMLIGMVIAVLLYVVHVNLEYGLISIPQGFLVTAYPISLRVWDFLVIGFTVIAIGGFASILPANRAARVPAIILEE